MTGVRKRSPTNKEFKRNFQGLAATRAKKGHLVNQEKSADDIAKETGTLVRIDRDKLYEKGWEVKVGTGESATTYFCSYGDGVMYIPDSTVTDKYFVPKGTVTVEITIDKKSKLYTITKINTNNKKPIALFEDTLTVSTDTNTDTNTNKSSIQVSSDTVNINSDNVIITDSNNNITNLSESQLLINNLQNETKELRESQKVIDDLQNENKEIQNKVDTLIEEKNSLLQRIQILEENITNNTENGE